MPPCAGHKEQRLFLSHDNLEEIGFADSMGNLQFFRLGLGKLRSAQSLEICPFDC